LIFFLLYTSNLSLHHFFFLQDKSDSLIIFSLIKPICTDFFSYFKVSLIPLKLVFRTTNSKIVASPHKTKIASFTPAYCFLAINHDLFYSFFSMANSQLRYLLNWKRTFLNIFKFKDIVRKMRYCKNNKIFCIFILVRQTFLRCLIKSCLHKILIFGILNCKFVMQISQSYFTTYKYRVDKTILYHS